VRLYQRAILVLFFFVIGGAFYILLFGFSLNQKGYKVVLCSRLRGYGLEVKPRNIFPLSSLKKGFFLWQPIVFIGKRKGRLRDIYHLMVRVSPKGILLDTKWLTNLSKTKVGDEDILAVSQGVLAYGTRLAEGYRWITVFDYRVRSSFDPRRAITYFQDTGRFSGARKVIYELRDRPQKISLRWKKKGTLIILYEGISLAVVPEELRILRGKDRLRQVRYRYLSKGWLTWLVDTARESSLIGAEVIDWMEYYYFRFMDKIRKGYYFFISEPPKTEKEKKRVEIGRREEEFMPLRLDVVYPFRLKGEGIWKRVRHSPLFYWTFLRVDLDRVYARVYMVLWDPREVELHLVAGTKEPRSFTGAVGQGMIPRRHISRLVAAFNGGFQAVHGEYGMVVNRRVIIPPKPYLATVVKFRSGAVGFGSWPPYLEGIPKDIVSLRQNMTVLLEDGKINPYRRLWWGSVPRGVKDAVYTVRTGLCLTKDRKMVYFWGKNVSHITLARAMILARCGYGIHLDMNFPHCGFEFYNIGKKRDIEALGDLVKGEVKGRVDRVAGLFFRARRMIRWMEHIGFPRYIKVDERDFFYLTRRKAKAEKISQALRVFNDVKPVPRRIWQKGK
jgi:hypothetical protein